MPHAAAVAAIVGAAAALGSTGVGVASTIQGRQSAKKESSRRAIEQGDLLRRKKEEELNRKKLEQATLLRDRQRKTQQQKFAESQRPTSTLSGIGNSELTNKSLLGF